MKKIICNLFFLIATSSVFASSDSNPEVIVYKDPMTVGYDELIEEVLTIMNVPGAAVGVIKDDQVVLAKGYGLRDVQYVLPVTTKTQFPIGSATKAFTTFLLGRLVDEGVIHWDDPIADHIPYFKLKNPHTTYEITIRDYLTHISGYPNHDGIWFNANSSRKDVIKKLKHIDPIYPFRDRFLYQNGIGYMIAAHAAEMATHKTYEDLIFEKIFTPLGMKDANFSIETMKRSKDYSEGYREISKQIVHVPHINVETIAAAGGINAHLEDMLIWLKTLLKDGDNLLEKGTWDEIISPQVVSNLVCNGAYGVENEVLMESYGLGWVVISYRNHLCVFHGGNLEGFSSAVLFFPREKLGVVVLCNRHLTPLPYLLSTIIADRMLNLGDAGWLEKYKKFTDYSKDKLAKAQEELKISHYENSEPSHPLTEYEGTYIHPAYGELNIRLKKSILEVDFNKMVLPLNHWHYDVFEVSDACEYYFFNGMKVSFQENVYGDIHSISIPFEPKAEEIVFIKQKDSRFFKDDYLNRFVGNYSYHGFGFKIERIEGSLVVKAFGQPPYTLTPESNNFFKVKGFDDYTVQFVINEKNDIVAVQLIQGINVYTAYRY